MYIDFEKFELSSVPRIQFEKSAYSIPEPSAKDQIAMVTVKVIRLGDVTKEANVRCSTRDGSAFSGTDYNPRSQILQFAEGKKYFCRNQLTEKFNANVFY